MKGKYQHFLSRERLNEIKETLKSESEGYYDKPCGYTEVMMDYGVDNAGFKENMENGSFGWLRSSGTFVQFNELHIYVSGRRNSIDEFLTGLLSKDELRRMTQIRVESWQPWRKLGDTVHDYCVLCDAPESESGVYHVFYRNGQGSARSQWYGGEEFATRVEAGNYAESLRDQAANGWYADVEVVHTCSDPNCTVCEKELAYYLNEYE